ncbi:MAG: FHA domain-containing protein [Pseudomonadota bacterium]
MKYLIRFITQTAAGGVEQNDRIVDAPAITLGRATDQVLQLKDKRARLQHARIEAARDGATLTSNVRSGVTVNGRSQSEATLQVGDVIEIGENVIKVIAAPPDVAFAISFELSPDASSDHVVAEWSAPNDSVAGWSKRRIAWTLAAVVLLVALVLPGLSMLPGGVASVTRDSALLIDDGYWLAGPVHNAHSSIADQCEACHVDAFQRVPDEACASCHTVDVHVASSDATVLGTTRCASCHLEHNEPPELVNQHQGLCADCHNDLPDNVPLQPAADFLDAHPDFKLSLLLPSENDVGEIEWQTEHMRLADARTADRSNLKFDHSVHLVEDGIITPDGKRVVECAECHVAEPGGIGMLPVSMDEHCSGCHTLAFDPDDPSRTVPHGDSASVVQALVEYYSARLLGSDPDAVDQRVRRPGQRLTRADRDRAAAEAREQALIVAEDLFERRACVTCHEVSRNENDTDLPWSVVPVRLTQKFYPHASFSHAAHDTEVTSCDSCHSASSSESAHDVLIPDIATCRDCHGSAVARRNDSDQTASTCIMCHGFHFEAKGEHGVTPTMRP